MPVFQPNRALDLLLLQHQAQRFIVRAIHVLGDERSRWRMGGSTTPARPIRAG